MATTGSSDRPGRSIWSGWSARLDAFSLRFQRPGVRLREVMLLFVVAISVVVVAVVAFFVTLIWIFS